MIHFYISFKKQPFLTNVNYITSDGISVSIELKWVLSIKKENRKQGSWVIQKLDFLFLSNQTTTWLGGISSFLSAHFPTLFFFFFFYLLRPQNLKTKAYIYWGVRRSLQRLRDPQWEAGGKSARGPLCELLAVHYKELPYKDPMELKAQRKDKERQEEEDKPEEPKRFRM